MEKRKERIEHLATLLQTYAVVPYKREFPWRENQTPYRVLLSELMLQQTQVERVKEKFLLFTKKYPSLCDIHLASLPEILLDWKGLGYMRRLKYLKEISRIIPEFPVASVDIPPLPGVGEYTRGALLAFAYNEFTPIIETNIRTVLCHHLCAKGEVCASYSYKDILPELFALSSLSPRHFYESCMDYGSFLKKEKVAVCKVKYKQSIFKGSKRELRAKTLFAILRNESLPKDDSRFEEVIDDLCKEGFISKTSTGYEIAQEVKAP